MISRLWLSTKPSRASKLCCRPPGDSTERRDRSRRNRVSRNAKTSNSMAKESEIGVCGCLGSMWSVRRNDKTGAANRWFRILVNQSCSIAALGQLFATSSHRDGLLNPSSQRCVQFVDCFAGDGCYRQKQASKQAAKARGKTG